MGIENIRLLLSVVRYHNKCKLESDQSYKDSSLHQDTKEAIIVLEKSLKDLK